MLLQLIFQDKKAAPIKDIQSGDYENTEGLV
jgi:hypothetical protein